MQIYYIFTHSNNFLLVCLYFVLRIDDQVPAVTSFVTNTIYFLERFCPFTFGCKKVKIIEVKLDHCFNVIALNLGNGMFIGRKILIFITTFEKCESTFNFIALISKNHSHTNSISQCGWFSQWIPVDTGRKLNVHKTFRRRPRRRVYRELVN